MATTIFTPLMLRGAGTRGIPEIPAGSTPPSFNNIYSLAFDGVDDYVDVGNPTELQITTDLSVSFWFKGSSTADQAIVAKDTLSQRCWGIWNNVFGAGNNLQFYIFNSNSLTEVQTSANYNDGNWHNVVCIFKPSTYLRIYVDGVLDGENTTSIPATIDNDVANLTVGAIVSSGIPIYEFEGNVDEVAIWNSDQSSNIGSIYSTSGAVDLTSLNPTLWLRNGDNGSYKSPQWLIPENSNKDKVSNYSLQFDGVDDYISMDSASVVFSSAYSVSFWFNADSFPSGGPGGRVLFSLHDASGGNLLLLYANTVGTLITYNNVATRTTGTTTSNIGTWYHCVITSDGTNMKLYKNGSLEDTNAVGNFTTGTVGRVSLAQEWDLGTPSDFYNGKIDEVAYFNSELNSTQVSDIYNSGVPTIISGASAYYKMGEDATFSTNWTVPDQVGSADGTSANMTIDDRIGDAPNSTSNALSYNMTESDREADVPT